MRYYEHRSRKAIWSFRVAVLAVLVFASTFVWHRFFSLPTPLALKIFGAAILVAVGSLTLAGAALVNIWNEGSIGAGKAFFALLLSAMLVAIPLWSLPELMRLPMIYDVTTDLANPPGFDRVAKIRQGQANPVHYEASFARLQAAAYPDLKTLQAKRSIAEVYSAVHDAVRALGWKIIDEQVPGTVKTGYIEAVDRTWIFGFTDDVAIRVTGSAKSAKIDVRSSSRFGRHDLGRNANRIRKFVAEVKTRLAQLDRAERMEKLVAMRQAAEKQKAKRNGRRRDEDDD